MTTDDMIQKLVERGFTRTSSSIEQTRIFKRGNVEIEIIPAGSYRQVSITLNKRQDGKTYLGRPRNWKSLDEKHRRLTDEICVYVQGHPLNPLVSDMPIDAVTSEMLETL